MLLTYDCCWDAGTTGAYGATGATGATGKGSTKHALLVLGHYSQHQAFAMPDADSAQHVSTSMNLMNTVPCFLPFLTCTA